MTMTMKTSKEIGKIFRQAREEQGLTVAEVCAKSRIHSGVVVDLENGVFDRLGKLYIKSFLKKYSGFLGLDTDAILKEYEAVSADIPSLEFAPEDIEINEKKDETVFVVPDERKIQFFWVGSLSVILIVLVFILVGMVRARLSGRVPVRPPRVEKRIKTPAREVKKVERVAASTAKPVERKRVGSTRSQALTPVVLKLKAQGEVWIQVKSGDDTLFAGILKKGESKTWGTTGTLKIWTGKAEVLDFYVNTRKLGVVTAGVVKNIMVSSQGIKIGDTWAVRLD